MTSWCSRRPSFRGTSLGRRPHGRASGRKGESENRRPELPVTSVFFQRKVFRGPWHPGTVPCSLCPRWMHLEGGADARRRSWERRRPFGTLHRRSLPARARDRSSFAPESMEPAPPKRSRTRSHSSGGDVAALPRLGVEPGKHHVAEHDGVEVALAHGRCEVELAQEPGVFHGLVGVDRPVGVEEGRAERPLLAAVARGRVVEEPGKRLDRAAHAALERLEKAAALIGFEGPGLGLAAHRNDHHIERAFQSVPPCRWE